MKKLIFITGSIALAACLMLSSCKKVTETHNISAPYVPPTQGITSTTLGVKGSSTPTAYAGTLLANTTYTVVGDIQVSDGDTLFIQSGVTVCVEDTSCIVVKGALVSIGTQTSPIIFTDCAVTPNNSFSATEANDPAWNGGSGWWSGIQCDTSCTLLVLKWTQLWFTGAPFHRQEPVNGTKASGTSYGIFFQRTTGHFIMEDCKMYGGIDDAVRVQTGNFEIMRNVFEKMGYQGGDCNNVKSGGVGDCAYNLYIGLATNGSKASDKGGNPVQCNMCMYNNTYINCGFRNASSGTGSDIDYEQSARGAAYNNLIVNCRIGFRVVASPVADTQHLYYSNNFIYGDSANVTSQFYPNTGGITKLDTYISPIPAQSGYVYNSSGSTAYNVADAAALAGANKPMFVNFPLPETSPMIQVNNYESNYGGSGFNLRLASGSPCIGTGTTAFPAGYPINACASVIIPSVGFTPNESAPSTDIGCYPYTNPSIGNQQ
jgi:hypothetical protein